MAVGIADRIKVKEKMKKRILIVGLTASRGGMETFFHVYYRYLDKERYQFDFVSTDGDVAFSKEYIENGSKVFLLPSFIKHPIKYYYDLRSVMRKNKYDIVHINMLSAANILPIKAARKERIPRIIVHSHNSGTPSGILRKMLHKINRHVLKNKNIVKLACGEKAGKWLFGDNVSFKIINNIVDINKFSFNSKYRNEIRAQYGVNNDEILLGNVGRLCEQKNQLFLIDILKKLDNKYKVMIIGSGNKRKEIERKIAENSLEKRVLLIDNTELIERYYNAFDIFVLPSIFEGLPIALIEAQVNGLPCLVSNLVTPESDIGSSKFLPLDKNIWAKEIKCNIIRRNNKVKEPFDTMHEVHMLQDVYEEKTLKPLVSIVVPVFNNEKYISKCLDSLIGQTYKNIEIIVINDGSTDNSEQIIKKYLKDKRIIYKSQKNSGANKARRTGIGLATGQYVAFVDSDDWIERNAIEILIGATDSGADIIRFNHYTEPGRRAFKHYKEVSGRLLSDKANIEMALLSGYNLRELAFGLYKSSLLANEVALKRKMSYGEDYYVNLHVVPKAKKILFCDYCLYHYRKNNNQSTTSRSEKKNVVSNYNDSMVLVTRMHNILRNMNTISKDDYSAVLANILDAAMWSVYGLARELDYKQFCEQISGLISSDIISDCMVHKRMVLKYAREKSFNYRLFHSKMITEMINRDTKKIYAMALKYNARRNSNGR